MKHIVSSFLYFVLSYIALSSFVQASDFKSFQIPIKKVIEENELVELLSEVASKEEGVFLFKTTSNFLGSGQEGSDTIRVELAQFSLDEDEETDVVDFLFDEAGYVYCRSQFVQLAGSGARSLSIWSRESGISYQLWIEGRQYFKGRNWAEGYIYVALVNENKYSDYLKNGTCELHDIEVTSGGM